MSTMNEIAANSTTLAFRCDHPLAPETISMARRIAEELARQQEPIGEDRPVWLSIPINCLPGRFPLV